MAAVIGTLLALLVFMTLFGIFLTQFLPLWMLDNESAEANLVAGQVGNIKSCLDDLALKATPGYQCTSPISMQSGGVPIFGTPTQATLSFQQIPQLFTTVTFNATGFGAPTIPGNYVFNGTPAQLTVNLPDRYYVPVTYSLTLGAVISSQGGTQQNMLFSPAIVGSNVTASSTSLSMTLYEMYGQSTSISSVGTSEVYASYLESENYVGTNTAVNLTMTTQFPCAWQQFYSNAFKGVGSPAITPQFSPALCSAARPYGSYYLMHAYFAPVSSFSLTVVYFDVQMGLGNPT